MPQPFYTLSLPYRGDNEIEQLVRQLNQILSSISDRLDAIEGRRGTAEINSDLSVTGQVAIYDSAGRLISGFVTTIEGA